MRRSIRITFFPCILFFFLASISLAVECWQDECVGISDGDTISVMKAGKTVKIRLYGIDCPESGQDFGTRAKEFVADLIFRKTVTATPTGTDRYGRTIAHIEINGVSVNRALVEAGLAWVYDQYCNVPECQEWRELQAEAKAAKRGLWSRPDAMPPWEWRRNGGGAAATTNDFRGNVKSRAFHRPGCRQYDCKNCTASFANRDDAVAAGYRPCGECKP